MSRVTIATVADAAGVHVSTVSRALNTRTRAMISPEVAERVSQAAARLGYRRNAVAAALRLQRSLTVGVVIPDITNPVFPPILRAIEDVLGQAGYTAIIANTDNDPLRQRTVIERMGERHVDGLILATAGRDDDLVHIAERPLVLINRAVEGRFAAVVSDDAQGIRDAVAHLVDLGHRDIAHIAGPPQFSTGRLRRQAFAAAMRAHRLPVPPDAIAVSPVFAAGPGAAALREMLRRRPMPGAIVAANDLLAIGCYDVLAERGLRCPQDVSIVGFNDMPFADRFAPPLSTVRIPHYAMGEAAARLLLGQIADPDATRETAVLTPELIVRGSSGPPAPSGGRAGLHAGAPGR